jgi:glycerol dehydrogenase-like iron-containing ADH family enzyme
MDCGTGMENLLVESGMVMRGLFEKKPGCGAACEFASAVPMLQL